MAWLTPPPVGLTDASSDISVCFTVPGPCLTPKGVFFRLAEKQNNRRKETNADRWASTGRRQFVVDGNGVLLQKKTGRQTDRYPAAVGEVLRPPLQLRIPRPEPIDHRKSHAVTSNSTRSTAGSGAKPQGGGAGKERAAGGLEGTRP